MPLLQHQLQWTFLLPINLPSPRWNPQSFNQTNIPLLNTASSCANAIWGLLRTICVQQCLFCIYIGTEDNWGPAASKASTNGQHHDVGNLLIKTNCAKVTTWNNTRRSLAARQQDSWHDDWKGPSRAAFHVQCQGWIQRKMTFRIMEQCSTSTGSPDSRGAACLRQLVAGLGSVFTNTASVESDFDLKWEMDKFWSSMTSLTLEGILQSRHCTLSFFL